MGASHCGLCHVIQLEGPGVGESILAPKVSDIDPFRDLMMGDVGIATSFVYMHSQRAYEPLEPPGPSERVEALIGELFCLKDLNSDGDLDVSELVILNRKIAVLHYGQDVDIATVKHKYENIFREHLDADGRPVPMAIVRRYVLQVLHELDPDQPAQEMILEQFIIEARIAREVFWNVTDTAAVIKLTGQQVSTVCSIDNMAIMAM